MVLVSSSSERRRDGSTSVSRRIENHTQHPLVRPVSNTHNTLVLGAGPEGTVRGHNVRLGSAFVQIANTTQSEGGPRQKKLLTRALTAIQGGCRGLCVHRQYPPHGSRNDNNNSGHLNRSDTSLPTTQCPNVIIKRLSSSHLPPRRECSLLSMSQLR